MKPRDCVSVEQNLWRYIDRELSAKSVSAISLHLKKCPACSGLYERRSRDAALYRRAFLGSPFGKEFAGRFESLHLDQLAEYTPEVSGAGTWSLEGLRGHGRLIAALGGAGLVLVLLAGLGLGWVLKGNPGGGPAGMGGVRDTRAPIAREDPALGTIRLTSEPLIQIEGPGGEALEGQAILPGYRYSQTIPGSGATLDLADGSSLRFSGKPWKLVVRESSKPDGMFQAELITGEVDVRVTPRGSQRPFVLVTPNARVRVLGTWFRLAVRGRGGGVITRLEVLEGSVSLRDEVSGVERTIAGGDPVEEVGPVPEEGPSGPPTRDDGQRERPTGLDNPVSAKSG